MRVIRSGLFPLYWIRILSWPDLISALETGLHADIRHVFWLPSQISFAMAAFCIAVAVTAHKTAHPASGENAPSRA